MRQGGSLLPNFLQPGRGPYLTLQWILETERANLSLINIGKLERKVTVPGLGLGEKKL